MTICELGALVDSLVVALLDCCELPADEPCELFDVACVEALELLLEFIESPDDCVELPEEFAELFDAPEELPDELPDAFDEFPEESAELRELPLTIGPWAQPARHNTATRVIQFMHGQ